MKSSISVSMVFLAVGIVIGGKIDSFAGNRGVAAMPEDRLSSPRSSATPLAPSSPVVVATPAVGSPAATASTALTLIDEMRNSDMENGLTTALGSDSTGLQVSRALVANRHQAVPGATSIYNEFMNELKSDPKSGVEQLQEALRRIPDKGYEADRMTLLQAANGLSGVESMVKDLAYHELTSNIAETPPAGDSGAAERTAIQATLVTTAYQIFLNFNPQPDDAFLGTLQAIVLQADPAVRRAMIDRFTNKYPDKREDLQKELVARDLDPYSNKSAAKPVEQETTPAEMQETK